MYGSFEYSSFHSDDGLKPSTSENILSEWSLIKSLDIEKKTFLRATNTYSIFKGYAKKYLYNFSPINWFISLFPIFTWIKSYSFKENLLKDMIAGLIVSILQIPQGMANGLLSGACVMNGIYVSIFPVIIYAITGTSKHISIGTFPIISMIVKKISDKVIKENISLLEIPTTSNDNDSNFYNENLRIEILTAICLITGIIMTIMGLMNLGSLSFILTDQIISAFSCGVALHVATSQTPNLFDIDFNHKTSGSFRFIHQWINIFNDVQYTNITTLSISICVLLTLIIFKEFVNPLIKKRTKSTSLSLLFPIDLIVIIMSTLLSYTLNLRSEYNVNIMGSIPSGLPSFKIPSIHLIINVIPDCFILSLVIFTLSFSLARKQAKKYNYTIKSNQELIALGSANIFSSFLLCYPCSASSLQTYLLENSGIKSQIASLTSSFVLLIMLYLGPAFFYLPKCILSCIVLISLKEMLCKIIDFSKYWNLSKGEGSCWLITFISTLLFDVDIGLIIGVVFSLIVVLSRFVLPDSSLLGRLRLPTRDLFVDIEQFDEANEIDKIKIFRFSSALMFLNCDTFKNDLFNLTFGFSWSKRNTHNINNSNIKCIIIDFSSIPFIDSSGVETITEIIHFLHSKNIMCSLASCTYSVIKKFERAHFLIDADSISKFNVFPSVHDALMHCEDVLQINISI